jgi:hypothetical protein
MDYREVDNEDNDGLDGHEQISSPFMQFETQDDEHNNEKRIDINEKMHCSNLFFFFRLKMESSKKSR